MAGASETLERGGQIADLEADVVDPLTTLLQKASHARIGLRRLNELDARPTGGEHRHAHPFPRDFFDSCELETQKVAIQGEAVLDRPYGHADVIESRPVG